MLIVEAWKYYFCSPNPPGCYWANICAGCNTGIRIFLDCERIQIFSKSRNLFSTSFQLKLINLLNILHQFAGVPVVVGVTIFILSFSSVSESAMVLHYIFKLALLSLTNIPNEQ